MKTIKTYYYTGKHNFGDVLNEYIPERLFGCKIVKDDVYSCQACFIGSILTPFLAPKGEKVNVTKYPILNIWGSGFIRPTSPKRLLIRNVKPYAVRGILTRELLSKYMKTDYSKIPLGDPGLLCSRMYKNLDMTKKYEYGIVPHYIDKQNKNLQKLQLPNSIILDIEENPDVFIKKLVQCKKIISSAMHGLIAADSFCIPNIRMILGDDIVGGDFKYNDYYSAFGIKEHNTLDLRNNNSVIKTLNFNYTITHNQIQTIQENLIRSFPYA